MKDNLSTFLESISKLGVILVILSALFVFGSLFTEFYETPKFLSLAILVAIILVLWVIRSLTEGKIVLKLTPLDLPLILLLVVAAISTFLSPSGHISLMGTTAKVNGSLSAYTIYILLYFLAVNLIKAKDTKLMTNILLTSGALLSIMSILSYAGVKFLPLPFTQIPNFTPTGSTFSTTAILALLLPFPLIAILRDSSVQNKLVQLAILVLFGVVITLTGSLAILVASAAALILTILTTHSSDVRKNLPYLIIPAVIIALITALSYIAPMGSAKNPLYEKAQNFPREIQLSFPTSWKISVSAFRDSPFVGSGPSTYLYNFTQYKPVEFNSSQFWNIRFDSAYNEYLGVLGQLGGLGAVALILLTLIFLKLAKNALATDSALTISSLTFFVILALHSSTLPLWILGLLILSLLMVSSEHLTRALHLRLGTNSQQAGASLDLLPIILLVVVLAGLALAGYRLGRFAVADFNHRKALNAVSQNQGVTAYNALIEAERLNPYNDLYRTDLAQTNFALANAIASSKGPTEASPTGSLTDEDKKNIQQLLQQAIAEGRTATALSPRSVVNWEILASIYRQISGVAQNATQFALDAYGRAIQRDPLNPILRLNVGGIYYTLQNYDMAIRFFSDAVNLKPDFANGYYNLAVALRDKGDLDNAKVVAEKVVSLLDPKSQDYQTASSFLADLKARIATGSAAESKIGAPAAEQTSPLQKNQPKVLDLPQKEDIATPPAVKR